MKSVSFRRVIIATSFALCTIDCIICYIVMREAGWLIGALGFIFAGYGNAADVPHKVNKARAIISVALKCLFSISVFFIFRNARIKTVLFFLLLGIETVVLLIALTMSKKKIREHWLRIKSQEKNVKE